MLNWSEKWEIEIQYFRPSFCLPKPNQPYWTNVWLGPADEAEVLKTRYWHLYRLGGVRVHGQDDRRKWPWHKLVANAARHAGLWNVLCFVSCFFYSSSPFSLQRRRGKMVSLDGCSWFAWFTISERGLRCHRWTNRSTWQSETPSPSVALFLLKSYTPSFLHWIQIIIILPTVPSLASTLLGVVCTISTCHGDMTRWVVCLPSTLIYYWTNLIYVVSLLCCQGFSSSSGLICH